MRTIALEEHYMSSAAMDLGGLDSREADGYEPPIGQLLDLGEGRLRDMDAGGIDLQVLGHTLFFRAHPSPEEQKSIARAANDQAAAAITAHPGRLAGFALLPMGDVKASVLELHRTVEELGFKGAMVNGRTDGRFLDHPDFFPLLEKAAELDVPLYLHPNLPTQAVFDEYYGGLAPGIAGALSMAAWGWHSETGLHALRMIATGVFDRLPGLQVIIGHMGEMIPVMLDRIEDFLTPSAQRAGLQRTVAETFRSNFWVTTSGFFTAPPLNLLLEVLGADRILFSVDYPYSPISAGREFLNGFQASPSDKEKISHLNAERLLRLPAS